MKVYFDNDGCFAVRVSRASGGHHYEVCTNNHRFYWEHLHELPCRSTEAEAQSGLDELAERLGLEEYDPEVPWQFKSSPRRVLRPSKRTYSVGR